MKFCTTCKTEKPFTDFYKRSKSSDGFQSTCKSCRKVIDAASYLKYDSRRFSIKERRDSTRLDQIKFMRRYKAFCGCRVCSEKEPVALDLHHTDPNVKEDNPSNLIGGSLDKLKAEIRKCIVLCSNCHRKYHAGLLELPL